MSKRRDETAIIVGEEMADELEERYRELISQAGEREAVVIMEDAEITPISGKCMTPFECEYCGNGFVVDLHKEAAKCPGCGALVTYEMIMRSISPMCHKMQYEGRFDPNAGILPGSASYPHPDHIRYGIRLQNHHIGLPETPPPLFPIVGKWKGESITDENRNRIHREIFVSITKSHSGLMP